MERLSFCRVVKVGGVFMLGMVMGTIFLGVFSLDKSLDLTSSPRYKCTELDTGEVMEYNVRGTVGKTSVPNPGYDVHADVMQEKIGSERWEPDSTLNNQGISDLQILQPGLVANVVHYLWCERKIFEFQHYLSVLSVVREINPDLIVFHYQHYPRHDLQFYNTWFEDLKKELPFVELVELKEKYPKACDSVDTQKGYVTDLLFRQGGIYVHFNTIFTHFPMENRRVTMVDGLLNGMEGFLSLHAGVHYDGGATDILKTECLTADVYKMKYASVSPSVQCVIKKGPYHPRDAWFKDDVFSKTANNLLYNSEIQPIAQPSNTSLIPNIGHLIWFGGTEVDFLFYLNVLSQLYIIKVDMLYVHGDAEPTGKYWEKVKSEGKVRFVTISIPNLVFRNRVSVLNHMSDIHRVNILNKYGGYYSDADVVWLKPIPPELRQYDVLASYDWPTMYDSYPDYIQSGVMLGKPGARYWKYLIHTFKTVKDDMYGYNGLLKPYKVLERHPDLVHVFDKLQVMCWELRCHPTWYPDFRSKSVDHRSYPDFNWREAHTFHWTAPTPEELKSEESLRISNTIFAEIGRYVLQAAGKL